MSDRAVQPGYDEPTGALPEAAGGAFVAYPARPPDDHPEPLWPQAGDCLGEFVLLGELGRGTAGRIFLATQPSLADRPVVLKMTPREGEEHLSLARLQHTHIVPLYSVHEFAGHNLRALCMPYLGSATLDYLLDRLHGIPPAQRTGAGVVEALDQGEAWPALVSRRGPARPFLARNSYVRAVCWVGACVARALQYAHERGLVHLDIKPSNVLIAADGQPMLLDFHLAREPIDPHGSPPDWIGGTHGCMAPEQRAAFAAITEDRPILQAVDGRADVYSLGLVLYEALGGPPPLMPGAPFSWLRYHNPAVPLGLADLVHKCIADDPGRRYGSAAELAADLERFLADQPLRGVSNRSLRERWSRWRRRRPYALAVASVVAIFLATAGLLAGHFHQRYLEAQAALRDGHRQLQDGLFADAGRTLRHGLGLVEAVPGCAELRRDFQEGLCRSRDGQESRRHEEVTRELAALADRLRFLYDPASLSPAQVRALEERCRAVWEKRTQILERSGAQKAGDSRVRADLLDVAVLGADLHVRRAAPGERREAQKEALELLAEAEGLFGPGPVLWRERQAHAESLGLSELARSAARHAAAEPPRTAWEHYALGRSLLRGGDYPAAAAELDRAVRLQPDGFWPAYYRGLCAYHLKDYEKALVAFSVCVALAPGSAECYYNRALAHAALGRDGPAVEDYDRALELQPRLDAASLNRGLVHFRNGRYAEALADLRKALAGSADPAGVRVYLARVRIAQHDTPAALAELRSALEIDPSRKEALELKKKLKPRRGGPARNR